MFFYEKLPFSTILMAAAFIVILLLANELTRRNKWAGICAYIVLPIVLTLFVWPKTGSSDATSGNWFAWVKAYSALAGVIGFMAIRYIKKLQSMKWVFLFPMLILSLNILEAVYRDIECFSKPGVVENGLYLLGGPWNILNATAGVINIVTITGWFGIQVAKTKSKDMIWPDLLWFWIIAYDIWNISYCYNCLSDRSFYAGTLLIISASLAAFLLKRGAWLQHRAQTLALYAMFNLTVPAFAESSQFAVKASHNPNAMLVLSIASFAMNVGVLIFMIIRIKKRRVNPYTNDIYSDLKPYRAALRENGLDG